LPVLGSVPEFSLLDQTGKQFGSKNLEGTIWVASFIYTSCPGPCPRLVTRVKGLQRRFGGEPGFRLVSFSVDPQTDTVEKLADYAATHAIDSGTWKLLTGPPDSVLAIIREGFFLAVARTSEVLAQLGSEDATASVDPDQGPISHSVRLALVDGSARIRGYYDSNDEKDFAALGSAVASLIGHNR
jgi:protein SCO1/2